MTEYNGKSVYGGIAIGKIHIMAKSEQRIVRHKIDDCNDEISRFEKAKTEAQSQLAALYDKAKKEVGEASAAIFEIHQMMLDDDDYLNSIKNIIAEQGVNAEYAVGITADNFSEMFSSMDDAYMKERAADVKDISERIIRILTNSDAGKAMSNEPVIILADDLARQ